MMRSRALPMLVSSRSSRFSAGRGADALEQSGRGEEGCRDAPTSQASRPIAMARWLLPVPTGL